MKNKNMVLNIKKHPFVTVIITALTVSFLCMSITFAAKMAMGYEKYKTHYEPLYSFLGHEMYLNAARDGNFTRFDKNGTEESRIKAAMARYLEHAIEYYPTKEESPNPYMEEKLKEYKEQMKDCDYVADELDKIVWASITK